MSLWRRYVSWLARDEIGELKLTIALKDLQLSMFKGVSAMNQLNEAVAEYHTALIEIERGEGDKKKVLH